MSARQLLDRWSGRSRLVACTVALVLAAGCASDGGGGGGGVSTSMHVGVGYGSYYGPGWYGGDGVVESCDDGSESPVERQPPHQSTVDAPGDATDAAHGSAVTSRARAHRAT